MFQKKIECCRTRGSSSINNNNTNNNADQESYDRSMGNRINKNFGRMRM